jgi:hypothetical protein
MQEGKRAGPHAPGKRCAEWRDGELESAVPCHNESEVVLLLMHSSDFHTWKGP